jgi:predicted nuclease of predicted toxin-antitoxin system
MTYLVDVNLPKSFSLIEQISCLFITDISDEMPDSEIWKMALANQYTILTRDKDFYNRAMQSKNLPKIVLFRLGNCRANELFEYFLKNISIIEEYLNSHQLIVLWPNEIQVVF